VIDKILFGLAAVMIAEGLVYLLAPHALETLLKALKNLSILRAGKWGLCFASWVHFPSVEPLDTRGCCECFSAEIGLHEMVTGSDG
jgi:uncharacterized protein YjeT (DUF2065 family)